MYRSLDPNAVVKTAELLRDRIAERFPGSGLSRVAGELYDVAAHAAERAQWSARPLIPLRAAMLLLTLLILTFLVVGVASLQVSPEVHTFVELVQAVESAVNDLVFLAAGLYFLVSMEGRVKRSRVLASLHELRSLAHIIDMHQLTKDPDRTRGSFDTPSSPTRTLNRFELGRYLDYCGEMLALIGKVAALYAQYTTDGTALTAVDQIEDLTSSLSNKIWQKIVILHQPLPIEAGA